MSYGKLSMSQVKPITRRGISATSRHNMRQDSEKWCTDHVNSDCSQFNTILIGSSTGDDIRADIEGCDMRHNSKKNPQNDIIAAEFVLSPSSEWVGSLVGVDDLDVCTPEICQQLKDNLQFQAWCAAVKEALAEERCINAVLHMDEKVPHVHCVCSVKMKRESKAKSEKSKRRSKKSEYVLSYSNYYGTRGSTYILATSRGEKRKALEEKYGTKYDSTQTPLGQLQTRIWEKVGKPFDMERGEAASETGIKGISVKEWKIQQEKKKIDTEADQEIERYKDTKKQSIDSEKVKIDEHYNEVKEKYRKKLNTKLKVFRQEEKKRVELEKNRINDASYQEISRHEEESIEYVSEEKAKIDKKSESEISLYQTEQDDHVKKQKEKITSEKSRIDADTAKQITDYSSQKQKYVDEEKSKIESQSQKDIESHRELTKQFVENACNELSVFQQQEELRVRDKKKKIKEESEKQIKEYEDKTKKEEEEELEKIKKRQAAILAELTRKNNEFEEQAAIKQKELEMLKEQLDELQAQEKKKLSDEVRLVQIKLQEIPEKVKASLALISGFIKQIDQLSESLQYTVGGVGAIKKLLSLKNRIMADGRMKMNRQMIARRAQTVKHIDEAIESAQNLEKSSSIIDSIKEGVSNFFGLS